MRGGQSRLSLSGQFARALEEVHIGGHLGEQDFGRHGFDQVVHRAQAVAPGHVDFLGVIGGDKDNGRLGGALAGPQPGGGLKTVHDRHLQIQQDDGKFVDLGQPQGPGAGIGLEEMIPVAVKDGLESQEILRAVVHQKKVHRFLRVHRFAIPVLLNSLEGTRR